MLNVNYSALQQVGTNVITARDEFEQELKRIKELNDTLKAAWEGEDSSKYSSAVEEQMIYMQKLQTTIEEIGQFLKKAADAYAEAMENNVSAINI